MATPIKNNLPPGSQQWVRDIERRMTDLERQNQLLQTTANRNAGQIASIAEGVRFAQTGIAVVSSEVSTLFNHTDPPQVFATLRVPIPAWANSVYVVPSYYTHIGAMSSTLNFSSEIRARIMTANSSETLTAGNTPTSIARAALLSTTGGSAESSRTDTAVLGMYPTARDTLLIELTQRLYITTGTGFATYFGTALVLFSPDELQKD